MMCQIQGEVSSFRDSSFKWCFPTPTANAKSTGIGKRKENHAKPPFQQIRFLLPVAIPFGKPRSSFGNFGKSTALGIPHPALPGPPSCTPSSALRPPHRETSLRPPCRETSCCRGRLGAASSMRRRAARARRGGVRRITMMPSSTRRRTARNDDTELPSFDGRHRRRFVARPHRGSVGSAKVRSG